MKGKSGIIAATKSKKLTVHFYVNVRAKGEADCRSAALVLLAVEIRREESQDLELFVFAQVNNVIGLQRDLNRLQEDKNEDQPGRTGYHWD